MVSTWMRASTSTTTVTISCWGLILSMSWWPRSRVTVWPWSVFKIFHIFEDCRSLYLWFHEWGSLISHNKSYYIINIKYCTILLGLLQLQKYFSLQIASGKWWVYNTHKKWFTAPIIYIYSHQTTDTNLQQMIQFLPSWGGTSSPFIWPWTGARRWSSVTKVNQCHMFSMYVITVQQLRILLK